MERFYFSVIMAIYNVEAYLREAVESLVHQTIGFRHIQLIMVDDGSTDGSGLICDEYQRKYPKNVVVIHKENGRQASARNAGLPYAKGEYVNFMDPDDKLARNAMKKVKVFMDAHPETEICCIPLIIFGEESGPHPLNYKFEQGTRVVNLLDGDSADCVLLSAASAFYRHEAASHMHFDTELYHGEDAKENVRLLLEQPVLGLVADTRYHYRKHGSSTVWSSTRKREAYSPYLIHFSQWVLDRAERRYGYIPDFVQHTVMYDLQWKWNQSAVPSGVLSEEEEGTYKKLLADITARIDDDIILSQKYMSLERKCFLLGRKYSSRPTERVSVFPGRKYKSGEGELPSGEIDLLFGKRNAASVSAMETVLEFLKIDGERWVLEGFHHFCGMEEEAISPAVIVGDEVFLCESADRKNKGEKSLNEQVSRTIGFRFVFPVKDKECTIRPAVLVDGIVIPRTKLVFGKFFPVTDTYVHAHAMLGDREIRLDGSGIRITSKPGLVSAVRREGALLKEIWDRNLLGGRKAVGGRLFYHMVKPFKRRKLWIISDRIMKADDNGEALFRYLTDNPPRNTDVVFAISRRSPDYRRMAAIGRCVDAMSYRHKLLHLLCDVVISSQADGVTSNPYLGHDIALRDLLIRQRFVFLQHGIINNDLSGWLNRYNQDIDGLVTSSEREKSSIVKGDYYYTEDKVWLTGLPRYDRLYHDEKRIVTIMPTWRRYLADSCDGRTGIWTLRDGFEDQDYYQFYNGLLNSEKLLDALSESGYTLSFFPHPNIQPHVGRFKQDPRVEFLTLDTSYREVYARSSLVLTDYSSAVFDFAYLRKPVIYTQFDWSEFFGGDHVYTRGYFDYERDGFGPVTQDLDETIDAVIEYVKYDCRLSDEYRRRIDAFFAFNDRNNCRRVVEKIQKLS